MKTQMKIAVIAILSAMAFSCNKAQSESDKLNDLERDKTVTIEVIEPQEVYSPPATIEKKKMSGAAKGAILGLGAGAVTGAVVAKKKPVNGAIVGGVIGATAGAVTGDIIENQKEKN